MNRAPRLRTALVRALTTVMTLVLTVALPAHQAQASTPAATTVHRIAYDKYSVTIDGRRVLLWSGEFHYWRLPSPGLWRDVLQKMKASGMNAVSIYFDWAYHSPAKGRYDFTGVRDVDTLLDMAREAGLYVIARPGPYINAETDGGGFPGWLLTQKARARSTDPEYLDAAREWLRHNEPEPQYAGGDGLDFIGTLDQYNTFCKGQWWVSELTRPDGTKPLVVLEAGTGWFQTWGDTGYDTCRKTVRPAYQKIVDKAEIMQGTTIENLYMAYGGTNWGWLADPRQVYTSYDYGAPITETRQTGADYDELKRQGLFYTTAAPLAETEPADAPASSDPDVSSTARANPDTKTRFLYLRHTDAMSTSDTTTNLNWQTPDGDYPVSVRLHGQTGKILVAGYDLGGQRLVYSTSELMTSRKAGDRDVAVLYGGDGDPGIDGSGSSLSAQALASAGLAPGAVVRYDGVDFTWPDTVPGNRDNALCSGQTVLLSGSGSRLAFLGTSTWGTGKGDGTVVYADGTRQPFSVAVPDWYGANASAAVVLLYRHIITGRDDNPVSLYTFAIDLQDKELASLVLPRVSDGLTAEAPALRVFAMTLA